MTKHTSTRELAYEALLAVDRDGMQSHLVIRDMLQKLRSGEEMRERAFFLRLTEGTIEYRLQLDHVINRYSKTKTQKMRPGIREILRMAVYQILYMDSVPDRAAVNEAVNLAVHKGFGGLRGFVNGVLRTIAREKETILNDLQKNGRKEPLSRVISVRYSISEEIVSAWLPRFGTEKTEAICASFLEDRPLAAHRFPDPSDPACDVDRDPACDSRDVERDPVCDAVRDAAHDATRDADCDTDRQVFTPTGILENAFFVKKGVDLTMLPEFREGHFYVQDLSSQIAVAAADIQPGDRVLDLCAAPGGKSFLAAERGAQVLSRDLTEEKAAMIRQNAERLGMLHKGVDPEMADAAVFDSELEGVFDVVIADLPCSGFGVCGRKPEIKYKPYKETVTSLAALQKTILANAVRYVKPGGKLLYSTCTIAEEENEANVRWLLETYGEDPGFCRAGMSGRVRRLLEEHAVSCGDYGVQLLPCDGPWDGFFFSIFQKTNA